MNPWRSIFLLCTIVSLGACGHARELRSPSLVQAAEFNQRAQHAFRRGEYQRAATLYQRALQLDTAVENVEGIAINSLNLARVDQRLGRIVQAEQWIDRLLGDQTLHYAPVHLAQAAAQKSLLRLQAEDATAATVWADKAAGWCGADCGLSGVLANVRTGIALHLNDGGQALFWSDRALAANRNDPQEKANAMRLRASTLLMMKTPDAAVPMAQEALQIDKSLGLPDKMRQDLLLLARVHEQLGQAEQAGRFRERAARIAATTLK